MNQQQIIQDLKHSCLKKLSQGDVNIYKLKAHPNLETVQQESQILVTGDGGHTHSVIGAKFIGKILNGGQFIIEAESNGVEFIHNGKHQPPFKESKGFYLIDRAREKGMLNDMVNPVSD